MDKFDSPKPAKPVGSKSSRVGLKSGIVISANAVALLFGAIVIWVAQGIGTSFHLNLLVCVIGALVGWGVGILASPFNKTEENRFISLGQAISAFVSGYLISKLDRFLEIALYPGGSQINNDAWVRAGLFVASCLLVTIVVFVNRTYWLAARTS